MKLFSRSTLQRHSLFRRHICEPHHPGHLALDCSLLVCALHCLGPRNNCAGHRGFLFHRGAVYIYIYSMPISLSPFPSDMQLPFNLTPKSSSPRSIGFMRAKSLPWPHCCLLLLFTIVSISLTIRCAFFVHIYIYIYVYICFNIFICRVENIYKYVYRKKYIFLLPWSFSSSPTCYSISMPWSSLLGKQISFPQTPALPVRTCLSCVYGPFEHSVNYFVHFLYLRIHKYILTYNIYTYTHKYIYVCIHETKSEHIQ